MYWLADTLIGTRSQQWRVAGDWRDGRQRRGILNGLIAVFTALSKWRKRQVAIRELSALDDRMLRDIGIARGEIGSIVSEAVNGRYHRSNQRFSSNSVSEPRVDKREKVGKSTVHHIEFADAKTDWQRAA